VLVWALWQIAQGFTSSWIANYAHVGGFVAGGLLGLIVPPRLPPAAEMVPDGVQDRDR
jgi:membrane associated rhomboid family serine protease